MDLQRAGWLELNLDHLLRILARYFCTIRSQDRDTEPSFGSCEKVTLKERRSKAFECVALGFGLDALANDLGTQISGAYSNHRANDTRLATGHIDLFDERDVQLDDIGLELTKTRESRVTRTQIIDRYSVAKLTQLFQPRFDVRDLLERGPFGDFQDNPMGVLGKR